jgi:DNA-binding HxlR family transcriptional regulator
VHLSVVPVVSFRLSERLEQLEDAGVVERRLVPGRPPHAEYRLTANGKRLAGAVTKLLQHR